MFITVIIYQVYFIKFKKKSIAIDFYYKVTWSNSATLREEDTGEAYFFIFQGISFFFI